MPIHRNHSLTRKLLITTLIITYFPLHICFCSLQQNEYEAVYNSFKISKNRNMLRKAVFTGELPYTALHEFDTDTRQKLKNQYGSKSILATYLK